ncbi:hypothetical protein BF2512_36 [Dickeya phage BF25/12]|uniref:Uncharacterized protein n=1 Tax=Dickeya phage BF25/12 TaxID=1698708 RepID=A0A219MH38_9CAUD|nr:hypothetical protein HOR10_gp36 [Dickeya phage BF25/12]ALA46493.1 hypothetical protein BF2512_36 [Dickeya phage BF25/12]
MVGGVIVNGLKLLYKLDKPAHPKYGRYRMWECPYCGTTFEALNYQAKNKSKRGGMGHCGCQTKIRQREKNAGRTPVNKLDDLTASANKVWQYSTKHGRSLTKEQVLALISAECHYCGAAPATYREIGGGKWARVSAVPTNGIDRMDSSKGYHWDNVVPCCPRCNMWKRAMPYADFINLCKTISERFSWVGA